MYLTAKVCCTCVYMTYMLCMLLDGTVDAVVLGTGTGGTLAGTSLPYLPPFCGHALLVSFRGFLGKFLYEINMKKGCFWLLKRFINCDVVMINSAVHCFGNNNFINTSYTFSKSYISILSHIYTSHISHYRLSNLHLKLIDDLS